MNRLLPLLLTAGAVAHAGVVYSNLDPSQQFDGANGWQIDGGIVAGQLIAAQFTPTENGILWRAQLAVGSIFTNLDAAPVAVHIAGDTLGLPGTYLADLTLDGSQTVGPFPTGNLVSYLCSGCMSLNAGTAYWLVAEIPNLGADHFGSQAEWNWNITNDYSTGANFAYNDTAFATDWQFGDNSSLLPAFQVDSTPEPESLILAGCGAIAVWVRKRRMRSRI